MPDKFGGETGLDPTIALEPVKPRAARPNAKVEAATIDPATAFADALVKALAANGGSNKQVAPIRYGEDNKTEVVVRVMNKRLHVSPADLALSKIHGNAYGIDGPSLKFEEGDVLVMRDGPGLQSMIAQGRVRVEERRT